MPWLGPPALASGATASRRGSASMAAWRVRAGHRRGGRASTCTRAVSSAVVVHLGRGAADGALEGLERDGGRRHARATELGRLDEGGVQSASLAKLDEGRERLVDGARRRGRPPRMLAAAAAGSISCRRATRARSTGGGASPPPHSAWHRPFALRARGVRARVVGGAAVLSAALALAAWVGAGCDGLGGRRGARAVRGLRRSAAARAPRTRAAARSAPRAVAGESARDAEPLRDVERVVRAGRGAVAQRHVQGGEPGGALENRGV